MGSRVLCEIKGRFQPWIYWTPWILVGLNETQEEQIKIKHVVQVSLKGII